MLKKKLKIPKSHRRSFDAQNHWMPNKKSEIRDFYDILERTAWVWRIFGVFPIGLDHLRHKKQYKVKKILTLYGVSLLLLRVGNFVLTMINFDSHFGKGPFRITMATPIIRATGNIMCIFASTVGRIPQLSVVIIFLFSCNLSKSINIISEQDLILNKMNCRPNYESTLKLIQAWIWTSLVSVIFFIFYDIKAVRNMKIISRESLRFLLWYAGLIVQLIDLTVLGTLVGLLQVNFHSLNKKIRAIVTRANTCSPKVLVTSDVCAEQLRFISELHYNMCAVGKRINRIFDWDVIINVTFAFVLLSTSLYYLFYELQRPGPLEIYQVFAPIQWELFHSVPMIIIVIICNMTTHQSIRAGKLIHEIRVENTDSELYHAVKSFSLQLHHQKLEFTAGGFFPIDYSLLQTMAGKITTYLVILIQFKPKLD